MTVPYTFGTATSSIPLSQLDSNFNTAITLGNTAIQLGNTATTLNNMTLANVTISSGNVTLTNVAVTTANITTANIGTDNITNGTVSGSLTLSGGTANGVAYLNGSKVVTSGSALTYNGTTLTAAGFSGPLTGNVTGNVSGTAATVTGATQSAITTAANLVTTGALNSGSITSGFGSIDVGTDAITGGAGSFTTLGASGTITGTAGTTSAETGATSSIYLSAGATSTKYAGIFFDGSTVYNSFFGRVPTALSGINDGVGYVTSTGAGTSVLRALFSSTGLAVTGTLSATTIITPGTYTTGTRPTKTLGGIIFDTTLNKLLIGGASAWEVVTSV